MPSGLIPSGRIPSEWSHSRWHLYLKTGVLSLKDLVVSSRLLVNVVAAVLYGTSNMVAILRCFAVELICLLIYNEFTELSRRHCVSFERVNHARRSRIVANTCLTLYNHWVTTTPDQTNCGETTRRYNMHDSTYNEVSLWCTNVPLWRLAGSGSHGLYA
jgi:hypothetical protein